MTLATVRVYAGSSPGARPAYLDAARALGTTLAEAGTRTVFGGASVGLMGAVADAALAAGGEVVGVIPEHLVPHEIAHRSLTELQVVGSMHDTPNVLVNPCRCWVPAGIIEQVFVGDASGSDGGERLTVAPTAAEIDVLERRVAATTGLLNATTAHLVELVAEALITGAWEQAGIRSPAHWLAWQTGTSLKRAKRLVRIARRSAELPVTTAAFGAGSLSEDQIGEIADHVPAAHDAELATFARSATVTQLHKVAREYSFTTQPTPNDPPDPEPRPGDRDDANEVSFGHDETGRWHLNVALVADLGALVQKALEACRDAEFHARHPDADADARPTGVTWVDALVRMADAALTGLTGDRPAGERNQIIYHRRASDPVGAYLHLGPAIPPEVADRVCCDTTFRYLLEDDDGVPLKLGRKQRTVTPQQRVVVEDRDKGCRRPGCTQARWLHIHHIDHWEHGGRTDIDRMCALCPRDHDLHHRGLLGITGDPTRPDGLTFTDHHGRVLQPCGTPTPPTNGLHRTRADLGIPPAEWIHPTGERLNSWSVSFRNPPPRPPAEDEAA